MRKAYVVASTTALLALVLQAGCTRDGRILLTVDSLEIDSVLELRIRASANGIFTPRETVTGGTAIELPTSVGLRFPGFEGSIVVAVEATVGAAEAGGMTPPIELGPGDRVEVTVLLEPGGLADCGNGVVDVLEQCDGSLPPATDCITLGYVGGELTCGADCSFDESGCQVPPGCGDGIIDQAAGEECEGSNLNSQDCGFFGHGSGMLQCTPACLFDGSLCGDFPDPPRLRRPMNNAFIGSVHAPGTLAPTFEWDPATFSVGMGAPTYVLEYSTDPALDAAQTTRLSLLTTVYTVPSDLTVASGPPAGSRYYWRVSACTAQETLCAVSPVRWINLGRGPSDFDGDGYGDAVVSAWQGVTGGPGYVHLFEGEAIPPSVYDVLFSGEANNDLFGSGLAGAGDLNGDGFAELVIGAGFNVGGGSANAQRGKLYVHFGAATLSSGTVLSTSGDSDGDFFGMGVAGAGDVDADGYDDLLVAVPGRNSGVGGATLRFGASGLSLGTSLTFIPLPGDDAFASVTGAGDLNNDGYADVAIGAYGADPGGMNDAGRVHIYLGGPTGPDPIVPSLTLDGPAVDASFGVAVRGVGDVNGDGYSDLLVGASYFIASSDIIGEAFLFLGADTLSTTPAATFAPALAGELFGHIVGALGDIDGDGLDDFAVSATEASGQVGMVWIFRGNSVPSLIMPEGPWVGLGAPPQFFGSAIGSPGDMNGDGISDWMVGAPSGGSNVEGIVYLYLGAAGAVALSADETWLGNSADDQLGMRVNH